MRITDTASVRWESAGKEGLLTKTVRRDDAAGSFLGLIAFERLVATGVHQHRGTAFSYMLSGGLTDHSGTAREGEVGVNFFGSTHDAIAYQPTLMVSRLEGPVVYDVRVEHALHAGATHAGVVNAHPEVPPDMNIRLESVRPASTWVPGIARRMVYDYAHTEHCRRLVDFTLLPGACVPRHRLSGLIDIFVLAGDLQISANGLRDAVGSAGFASLDAGEEVSWTTRYGAHLLAWAEGPSSWVEAFPAGDHAQAVLTGDFYGFGASYSSAGMANK